MLDQKSQMGPPFDRQDSQTSYKSAKIFRLSSIFTKQNTSPDYSHAFRQKYLQLLIYMKYISMFGQRQEATVGAWMPAPLEKWRNFDYKTFSLNDFIQKLLVPGQL